MEPPASPAYLPSYPPTELRRSTSNTSASDTAPDESIMNTNEEATLCKLDAVRLGYWDDPFLSQMIHGTLRHERKAPDMYKGYYARVKCVERLVLNFINTIKKSTGAEASVQIVNLGAGYDTLYWRLKTNAALNNAVKIKVVDLDLLPVISKKNHAIRTHKQLFDLLTGEVRDGEIPHAELHSDGYDLVSADMRDTDEISRKLVSACKLDPKIPTLFIAECVLIYMSTDSTKQLLTWIAQTFQTCAFINYEQVRMNDHFGQIMFEALKAQGCLLADADACETLEMHENRFVRAGWTRAQAADMNTMCQSLPQTDIQRVDRIAMIDEPEVLQQLFAHYCIVWAYKGTDSTGLGNIQLL